MEKETKNLPTDLRGVAEVSKKRFEEELSVLRSMSGMMDGRYNEVFFRLPMAVHNLAVIDNRHIYLLIDAMHCLHKNILADSAYIREREQHREVLETNYNLLNTLLKQEQEAQSKEREKGNIDMETMQHVEYDMSLFLPPIIQMLCEGYAPKRITAQQMRRLVNTCQKMYNSCLQAKEKAYMTASKICNS